MLTVAASNSILQTIVDEHMRGRLVAIYVMSFLGMAPIGKFLGGTARRGDRRAPTFLVDGLVLLVLAGIVVQRDIREVAHALDAVYTAKGIPRREVTPGRGRVTRS